MAWTCRSPRWATPMHLPCCYCTASGHPARSWSRHSVHPSWNAAGGCWQRTCAGHGRSTPLRDATAHAHARHVDDVRRAGGAPGSVGVGGCLPGRARCGRGGGPWVDCSAVIACLPAWSGPSVPGRGPHAAIASEVASIGIDGILERLRRQDGMAPWLRDVLLRDWPTHAPASLAAALIALDGGDAPTVEQVGALRVPLALVGVAGRSRSPDRGCPPMGRRRTDGTSGDHRDRRPAARTPCHGGRRCSGPGCAGRHAGLMAPVNVQNRAAARRGRAARTTSWSLPNAEKIPTSCSRAGSRMSPPPRTRSSRRSTARS
jgi:hypothetical protein